MPSGPRAGKIPSHRRGYWEDASLDSDPLGPLGRTGSPHPHPAFSGTPGCEDNGKLVSEGRGRYPHHLSRLPAESPDEATAADQESEDDLSASRTSLERQAPHRGNTMVHVCWHRNTSVSMVDFSIAVEVRSERRVIPCEPVIAVSTTGTEWAHSFVDAVGLFAPLLSLARLLRSPRFPFFRGLRTGKCAQVQQCSPKPTNSPIPTSAAVTCGSLGNGVGQRTAMSEADEVVLAGPGYSSQGTSQDRPSAWAL